MEAEHQTLPAPHPQGTTTPLLPACLRPELHIEGGGVGSCRPREWRAATVGSCEQRTGLRAEQAQRDTWRVNEAVTESGGGGL